MKKLFYLFLLAILFVPIVAMAEVNFEEVHNSISKNNSLTIKSIPFEYYKESKYYEACLNDTSYDGEGTEESCANTIYRYIVTSHINKNYTLPEGVNLFVSCDAKNNTCDVELHDNKNYVTEKYDIEFISSDNNNIYNISKNSMDSLKKNYTLDDMGYINQLINYDDIEKFVNTIQSSGEIFKIYPEIKDNIEKNPHIKYVSIFGAGGQSPLSLGAGGVVVAYYNDIAVGISDHFYYTTYRIVYIPDTTENTTEAYIQAALNRIETYINDDSYEVNIVYNEDLTNSFCGGKECNFAGYKTKIYKLTINDKEYNLGISTIPEKDIKKLNIKSKDYKKNISVETTSSDVPLDVSVNSEDVTENHEKDGFVKAYDINLYSGIKDEYITKIKDGIVVRIPLDDDFDKDYVDIYHIKDDGTKGNKYNAKVEEIEGKKYAVFTTDHFSTYAVSETVEVPNTYDGLTINIIMLVLSTLTLSGIYVYSKK